MRLIDADALLNELWAGNTHTEAIKVTAAAYLINDQPTIDPRERIVAALEKLYAYTPNGDLARWLRIAADDVMKHDVIDEKNTQS